MSMSDLAIDVFLVLRNTFFDLQGKPRIFTLRDKKNTQDDPLDEYIVSIVTSQLSNSVCQRAGGPLISPDFVIYRPDECINMPRHALINDVTRIVGIEVKKLERSLSGQVARSTGLDYNTTPPCGTLRVYDSSNRPLDIRGYYLFVCLEKTVEGAAYLSALTLCDGDVLNADFDLYLQITGQREKAVGLGTYGDGANRNRPMLIFANPLGAAQLDHAVTLICHQDILGSDPRIELVYEIGRTIPEGGKGVFYAYRSIEDIPPRWEVQNLMDPFPRPARRMIATQARGRFKLPLRFLDQG